MKTQPTMLDRLTGWSPRFDRRRIVVLLLLGLLTAALLLTLGGGRAALRALAGADWRWLGLAVVVHYSGFALRGWRWQQLLANLGHGFSWRYTTALLISGWFVSALLPARAGDLMRVGVLRLGDARHPPVPVADGLGSLVLERALDLLAILLLGLGFAYGAFQEQVPAWVMAGYLTGVGGLVIFGGTLVAAPALLERLRHRIRHSWWEWGMAFVVQLVAALRTLGQAPGRAALVLLASLYIWLCDALLMWLAVHSLGAGLSFARAAFVALTVDVFATVPLTPGGVGQVEAVNAALLALLRLPESTVVAAVLINRAISYWSFLLFSGAVAFGGGFAHQLARREVAPA